MTTGKNVEEFEAAIGKGGDASFEEFRREVRNAYMDRTRQVYFIWKKLKETHPEVDADRVVREAAWDFGVYQGRKIAARAGRNDLGPTEVLLGQTSKGGMAVFDQEIVELGDDRAIKIFHSCPHVGRPRGTGRHSGRDHPLLPQHPLGLRFRDLPPLPRRGDPVPDHRRGPLRPGMPDDHHAPPVTAASFRGGRALYRSTQMSVPPCRRHSGMFPAGIQP